MKLWIDDTRPAPEGYIWCRTVVEAKSTIDSLEFEKAVKWSDGVTLIDIDHDAGDYAKYGGDYIKLLEWLELTRRNYPIRIHSMNPGGVANMRAIIERNGWKEIR